MSDNDSIGINVGADVSKSHVKAMSSAIRNIFEDGRKYSMDQETIKFALNILGITTKVENVSINSCNVTGLTSKTINMDGEEV